MESSRNPLVCPPIRAQAGAMAPAGSPTGRFQQFPQAQLRTGADQRSVRIRPCGFLEESMWSPRGFLELSTISCTCVNNWVNPVEQLEECSRMNLGQPGNSTDASCSSSRHPIAIPTAPRPLTSRFGRSPQNPQCLLLLQFFSLEISLENRVCGKSVEQRTFGTGRVSRKDDSADGTRTRRPDGRSGHAIRVGMACAAIPRGRPLVPAPDETVRHAGGSG